jgi:hypothetical protein
MHTQLRRGKKREEKGKGGKASKVIRGKEEPAELINREKDKRREGRRRKEKSSQGRGQWRTVNFW